MIAVVLVVAGALGWALVDAPVIATAPRAIRETAVLGSAVVVSVVSSPTPTVRPAPPPDEQTSKTGVTGRVRARDDEESGPVPGVDVVATRGGAADVLATTDADGRFALALSPGRWTLSLRPLMAFDAHAIDPDLPVDDRGWPEPAQGAPREAQIDVGPEDLALDLRVRSQGLVVGRVVDDLLDTPIAGAVITFGATPDLPHWTTATTDSRGRFFVVSDHHTSISGMPSSTMLVQADGYAAGAADVWGRSFPPSSTWTIEVRLLRPVRLQGRVVDPEGRGLPDVGLTVTAALPHQPAFSPGGSRRGTSGHGGEWTWSARTGPDGAFVVEGLAPSVSPEHTEVKVEAKRRGWKQVGSCTGIAGPGAAPLTVVVAPEVTVAGTVVNSAGAPIEGACVARLHRPAEVRFERETHDAPVVRDRVMQGLPGALANRRLADRYYRGLAAATAPDGRFVLDGLAPGAHTLAIRAPGHGEVIVRVSAPETGLRVVLAPGRSFRGRVLDGAGEPLAGATVRAMRAGTGPSARESLAGGWPGDDWDHADERGAAITDAEGRFAITDLGADSVDVLVVREAEFSGDWRLRRRPEVVAFADGARTDGVEIALRASGPRAVEPTLDVESEPATLAPHRVGHVEVLVRGRPDRPLRSLDVVLLQRAKPQRLETRIAREQQTATWLSPPLEPGTVEVRVEARDWDAPATDPAQVLATRSVRVVEGETTHVVVDLRP